MTELPSNFFRDVFTSNNGICPSVVERIGSDGLSTVTFTPNLVRQLLKKTKAKIYTAGLNLARPVSSLDRVSLALGPARLATASLSRSTRTRASSADS